MTWSSPKFGLGKLGHWGCFFGWVECEKRHSRFSHSTLFNRIIRSPSLPRGILHLCHWYTKAIRERELSPSRLDRFLSTFEMTRKSFIPWIYQLSPTSRLPHTWYFVPSSFFPHPSLTPDALHAKGHSPSSPD